MLEGPFGSAAAVDFLGHLAYAVLIVGHALVARGKATALGFALRFCGSLGWAAIGLALGLSSLVVWSLAFAVLDLRGALRAGRG